jgi:Zn-finger nucleic acid-binding protein
MTIETLNCPNCGAGVASDSTQCEFCKTRLKTMACPSCFGLMFIGSQFCDHCGAKAVQTAVQEGVDLGECPRCRLRLELLQIGSTALRQCRKCSGLWADVATFEKICADREEQSAVLGFIGKRELTAEELSNISYVPCPDCKLLMNRSNFARASGVIIDTCKQHGVWFDAEELPKIIEFIQKGGIELARRREKDEIAEERRKLRDEQGKQAAMDQRFGAGNMWDEHEQSGIRRFVQGLFS